MKKLLLILGLMACGSLWSQQFDFTYDHYSFIVKDLKKTGDFYAGVLGLEEIPHPTDTVNFRWFRVRGNTQVHLIRKDEVEKSESKSVHLCLAIRDLDGFIAFLESRDIPYWDWPGKKNAVTDRADGVRQIYLRDPENNWVEINTAEHNFN
ncbi:VOC family protein [Robiginitalea sp. SC105]|uniref:VOC family protein n=1 Tax=Robiginitalea sp. SC105 TaxID=2762332 RepID=UPI00163A596B|nr:VOC family protein [Robiginitalea sp. SC105]MBC2840377.1 VOC family protein [Robiginitalea sp. SC105]